MRERVTRASAGARVLINRRRRGSASTRVIQDTIFYALVRILLLQTFCIIPVKFFFETVIEAKANPVQRNEFSARK